MTSLTPFGPLAGLKVVELGQLIAGPFAGKTLADFGAEVIKIEPPAAEGKTGGDPHISRESIGAALRRMGYQGQHTAHGFRTTASTLLHEQGFHSDMIERQLAHAERNRVKAAYNRAQHLPERKKMMQAWADYLDSLKAGAAIIPFQQKTPHNNTPLFLRNAD